MAKIPYHTHTFTIPTATKEDVGNGVASDLAVTPDSLGKLAAKDTVAVTDVETSNIPAAGLYLEGAGRWIKPVGDVPSTRQIVAGTGLTGGGDLSADRTISLSQENVDKLTALKALANKDKATIDDIAATGTPSSTSYLRGDGVWETPPGGGSGGGLPATRLINAGTGLTGGGDLSDDRTISLSQENVDKLAALKALANKDKATIDDIAATGTPSDMAYLRGDGTWRPLEGASSPFVRRTGDTMTGPLTVSKEGSKGSSTTGFYSDGTPYVKVKGEGEEEILIHIYNNDSMIAMFSKKWNKFLYLTTRGIEFGKPPNGDMYTWESLTEIGKIQWFAGRAAGDPENFLPCDGRLVYRNYYQKLFDRIGTEYGAPSEDEQPQPNMWFRLPDLRGDTSAMSKLFRPFIKVR